MAILELSEAMSKRCKIGGKLVLIARGAVVWSAMWKISSSFIIIIRLFDMACQNAGHTMHNRQ